MKPFLLIATRDHDQAAADEYQVTRRHTGLRSDQLEHLRLESTPMPPIDLDDYSGILLGGSAGVLTRDGEFHTSSVGEVIREDLLERVYATDLRVVYVEQLGRAVCETPALTNPEPITKGRALR